MSKKRSSKRGKTELSIGGLIMLGLMLLAAFFFDIDLSEFELFDWLLDSSQTVQQETIGGGGQGDWYEIYFTSATCPPRDEQRGGIDEIIAADIRQAQQRVDVAAYEFESEAMATALLDARQRGVLVRVVTDSDNVDRPSIPLLRQNGIHVVEDQRSAFMHNKFVIIDEHIVWTGSMNFTPNDVYCNNNNMVRMESSRLAANYTAEMDEMYIDGQFGPTSPVNTPYEQLVVNNIRVENYFAPETRIAPILVERVESAQEEILFMAFSYTLDVLGEAMIEWAEAGVTVRGVYETTGSQTQFGTFLPKQATALPNLQVRLDGNPRAMHHKVILIDREVTIFGSANFSASANERNDENIVIVHDPIFTSYFVDEFEFVWSEARE